jgi:hypothetical protein
MAGLTGTACQRLLKRKDALSSAHVLTPNRRTKESFKEV